jgi:hypothetical protein
VYRIRRSELDRSLRSGLLEARRLGVICVLSGARATGSIDVRELMGEYESTAAVAVLGGDPGRAVLS